MEREQKLEDKNNSKMSLCSVVTVPSSQFLQKTLTYNENAYRPP